MTKIPTPKQIVAKAMQLIEEHGKPMTLQQIKYAMFVESFLDGTLEKEAAKNEYARLGAALSNARKRGIMPWHYMIDIRRKFKGEHDRECQDGAAYFKEQIQMTNRYKYHRWIGQPYYVEVWTEKEAVESTVLPVITANEVVYGAACGNASLSWIYEAVLRFETKPECERIVLLYTDHDKTGRNIPIKLQEYFSDLHNIDVKVLHKGLTKEQVDSLNLLPDENGKVLLNAIPSEIFEEMMGHDINEYFDEEIWSEWERKRQVELETIRWLLREYQYEP